MYVSERIPGCSVKTRSVRFFIPAEAPCWRARATRLIALTTCGLMENSPEPVETLLAQFGLHRDFFARALEIGATSVQELQVVANAHEGGVPEDVALHAALQLLPRSTPVRVEGLIGSQELNGCSGRVLGPHTNERVPVRLDVGDGSTESVRVRPRNLQLALNLLMLPTEQHQEVQGKLQVSWPHPH